MFSENLKMYRKIKNISQTDLAREINTTPQLISSLERGLNEPSFHCLIRIARALDVNIDQLVEGVE